MLNAVTPAPATLGERAAPDLTIVVAGHVLDYRDTGEIRGYLAIMAQLGLIPWAVWQAKPIVVDPEPWCKLPSSQRED